MPDNVYDSIIAEIDSTIAAEEPRSSMLFENDTKPFFYVGPRANYTVLGEYTGTTEAVLSVPVNIGNSAKTAAAKIAVKAAARSFVNKSRVMKIPLHVIYKQLEDFGVVRKIAPISRPTVPSGHIKTDTNEVTWNVPSLKLENSLWFNNKLVQVRFRYPGGLNSYYMRYKLVYQNLANLYLPSNQFRAFLISKGVNVDELDVTQTCNLTSADTTNEVNSAVFTNIVANFLTVTYNSTAGQIASAQKSWQDSLPGSFSYDIDPNDPIDVDGLIYDLQHGTTFTSVVHAARVLDQLKHWLRNDFSKQDMNFFFRHEGLNVFTKLTSNPPYGGSPDVTSSVNIISLIATALLTGNGLKLSFDVVPYAFPFVKNIFITNTELRNFLFSNEMQSTRSNLAVEYMSGYADMIVELLYRNEINYESFKDSDEYQDLLTII